VICHGPVPILEINRSPALTPMVDGDPDDQFDDATQSLAQREAEAHDGSDRRKERDTMAADMNGDQPGESGRQCGLGDRQSRASPAPQSVLELRGRT